LRAAGCVYAEAEAELILSAAGSSDAVEVMVGRRAAGEPLEVVVGWAEFRGLRVEVDRGVFVPRRRTEFLARLAAEQAEPGSVVLDMCCGTGAIAAAVAASLAPARCELWAADVDPAAVACARRNLADYGATVVHADLFAGLPHALRGRIDVLVANVPYVPSGAVAWLPTEARDHEPRAALDGGPDGLDVLRRVVADAGAWLSPRGWLASEVSAEQARAAVAAIEAAGLRADVDMDPDVNATVVAARRPGI
jgi:release factor glutamine methyltransferase